MKRSETEILQWYEIFTNGAYKNIASLQGIIDGHEEVLKNVLSMRIPLGLDKKYHPWTSIEQYNIETADTITNMSTHNSLDFQLMQWDKHNKKQTNYSPYSDPWYNIYANMLCAYYEYNKKKPILNFPDGNIEQWNKSMKHHDNPLIKDMINTHSNTFQYLHLWEFFKQDQDGISRIILPWHTERQEEWFGTQGDKAIFQFVDYFYNEWSLHRFTVEKDLLNLFLQSYIDVNRAVAWPVHTLNLKKIADVLFSILENPEMRADCDKVDFKIRYEEIKD